MKVLYICGREPSYVRNAVIIDALKKNYDLVECTSNYSNYILRNIHVIIKFIFIQKKSIDFFFVGFLGHHLMPIVNFFTKKPIIFDAFISIYDSVCFDRKYFSPSSIFGKFFYNLDKFSCKLANKVLLDTKTHCKYFTDTFDIKRSKLDYIYVTANNKIFYFRDKKKNSNKFRIFYYGSALPIHGIETIIAAAKILKNKYNDLIFSIIGPFKNLSTGSNVPSNIQYIRWVDIKKLPHYISNSDICLGGHFSDIEKAKRVIAGKTFQFLAMKKTVIVSNNSANNELFTHNKNVFMCEPNNPEDLSNSIIYLKNNKILSNSIAQNGYIFYNNLVKNNNISKKLDTIVNQCLS